MLTCCTKKILVWTIKFIYRLERDLKTIFVTYKKATNHGTARKNLKPVWTKLSFQHIKRININPYSFAGILIFFLYFYFYFFFFSHNVWVFHIEKILLIKMLGGWVMKSLSVFALTFKEKKRTHSSNRTQLTR